MEDEIEQQRVQVSHADKAEDSDNDTPELNFVVFGYATEELVGDLAIKDND
jgi:hypothetical protein